MKELKGIRGCPDPQVPRASQAGEPGQSLVLRQPFLGLKVARVILEFQEKKEILVLGVLKDPQVSQ